MTIYQIYSWNINGIRASIRKGFDKWLESLQNNIVCLQEVKATYEQIPKEIEDLGDYSWNISSAERKGYSGVGNFYRTDYEPISISSSLGESEFDKEGRVLIAKYPEFTLFNVYFPNGKKNDERLDYKMRFYERFLNICKELLESSESIIVCGDVNTAHREIDLARPKDNAKYSGFLPQEREWIDKFLDIGFVDSYRYINGDLEGSYTWWTQRVVTARPNNVGWRIDYFFVSNDLIENLKDAKIHPQITGSDHCPLSITLRFDN